MSSRAGDCSPASGGGATLVEASVGAMLANGSQLPLALAVPCRQVLLSSAPQLGELWNASRWLRHIILSLCHTRFLPLSLSRW